MNYTKDSDQRAEQERIEKLALAAEAAKHERAASYYAAQAAKHSVAAVQLHRQANLAAQTT